MYSIVIKRSARSNKPLLLRADTFYSSNALDDVVDIFMDGISCFMDNSVLQEHITQILTIFAKTVAIKLFAEFGDSRL